MKNSLNGELIVMCVVVEGARAESYHNSYDISHLFLCFCRSDPDRPHTFYDLSKDADQLLSGMELHDGVGFTTVKHWPPK
jgi:hypothetical protein